MKKLLVLSVSIAAILIIVIVSIGIGNYFILRSTCRNGFCIDEIAIPQPPAPSASNPITQTEIGVAYPGTAFGTRVSVFNPTSEILNVTPNIKCDAFNISTQANAHLIQSGNYSTFPVIGTVPGNVPPAKYLCHTEVSPAPIPKYDFTLDVQSAK